jgi:biotin operon repressor
VELTQTGREFYETEIAIQTRLSERVSDARKFSKDSRVTPRTHGEAAPPATAVDSAPGDRHRLPRLHEQRYLGRRDAIAALGAADPGSISVVDYPVAPQSDRAEGRWHAEDDRLAVSCEADNPLTLWTTLALTLADRRTFEQVLTKARLEKHDVLGMLADGKSVLRGMRTIGWLPSDVTDYEALIDALLEAAEELGDLTREYANSDDDALRSWITRHALGLAGSLTQLCDLVDIEVVRLVKLPEFDRRFTDERAAALWRSLAIGSAIGSSYGHHTVYRQLFEDREEKRQAAFEPTVDAANPTARLTGSWVLAGDFGGDSEAIADAVETAFAGLDPHEDAPEIRLRCHIHTRPTRRQVAATARRMLATKDLEPTPAAISLLHALARTPFDVADALERLAGDNHGREIDIAEVRYALMTLDAGRLLRGYDDRCTTPRKVLAALLDATTPLTQVALVDAAGVSRRSLWEHLGDLEEVGLIEETDGGRYELAMSTTDVDGNRYADRTPYWVTDPTVSPEWRAAARAVRIGREYHTSGEATGPPGWPYEGPRNPPDLRVLVHPAPWLQDLAIALWGLAAREDAADCVPDPIEITAGPTVTQTPLSDADDGEQLGVNG